MTITFLSSSTIIYSNDAEDLNKNNQDCKKNDIEEIAHLTNDFINKSKHSQMDVFSFIAKNTNPHWLNNIFNLANFRWNLNCITCSNAVDLNLESLLKNNITTFYAARSTDIGNLDSIDIKDSKFVNGLDNRKLSDIILEETSESNRYIIDVPVNGYNVSHALNVVRSNNNKTFIIDGQNGLVYDLDKKEDIEKFNRLYSKNSLIDRVMIYKTGSAPEVAQDDDISDFEILKCVQG